VNFIRTFVIQLVASKLQNSAHVTSKENKIICYRLDFFPNKVFSIKRNFFKNQRNVPKAIKEHLMHLQDAVRKLTQQTRETHFYLRLNLLFKIVDLMIPAKSF
jgi:hypothetical protein